MALSTSSVPLRWLCGPLDTALGNEKANKALLAKCLDPALIDPFLQSPVNCLVVTWAAGRPEDAAQQKALLPLIARARQSGLSVAGLVSGPADPNAAAQAGVDLITEQTQILPLKDCVWPAAQGTSASSGPTGSPWIDSNGWLARLSRTRFPSKTPWLLFNPPAPGNIVRVEAYLRAIADSGMWGARWVINLDESLRSGLVQNEPNSLTTWKTIAKGVAFFEKHREWSTWDPVGQVGVISDFAGENEANSGEILNLLARLNLPFRIVDKAKAATAPFAGYRTLVCMDEGLPDPVLRRRLLAFAQQGGTLVLNASWKSQGGTPAGIEHPRLEIRTLGKGKLGIWKTPDPDPFLVARDTYMMLGRAHDVVRFFNIASFLSSYKTNPNGRAVIQIVNHANRLPGDVVTVWCPRNYPAAKLWSIESDTPTELRVRPENNGAALDLPTIPTYAAVETSSLAPGRGAGSTPRPG